MPFRPRHEIEASEGRDVLRLAKRGGGSLIYVALVVAMVVVVLAVTYRLNHSIDFTTQRANKLSPQSMAVLGALDKPVRLVALLRRQPADRWERYWDGLRRFDQASGLVRSELIDPVMRPGVVRQLGLDPEQQGTDVDGMVVAVRGERKVAFRGFDEEEITNAILEVGREGRRVVGLLRGYGERDPASDSDAGFAAAVQALDQEYYDVRDVWLSDGIPPDVLVLIAAGPRLPIPRQELDLLADWLDGGGRLLALLDPGEQSGLNEVLDRWGVRTTGQTISDSRENMNRDPSFLRVTDYTEHEAVRAFGKNYPTVFPTVGAVTHYEVSGTIYHDDLARSSHFSWGAAEDGSRTPGPLAVAAAVWRQETIEGRERLTRVVVIGDSDFASRAYLPARTNRNFLLNCVGWLSRQEELISIRRQPLAAQRINLEAGEYPLVYGSVFAAPVVIVIAGILMSVRRRRL